MRCKSQSRSLSANSISSERQGRSTLETKTLRMVLLESSYTPMQLINDSETPTSLEGSAWTVGSQMAH
jgi:hypothetical protein